MKRFVLLLLGCFVAFIVITACVNFFKINQLSQQDPTWINSGQTVSENGEALVFIAKAVKMDGNVKVFFNALSSDSFGSQCICISFFVDNKQLGDSQLISLNPGKEFKKIFDFGKPPNKDCKMFIEILTKKTYRMEVIRL